MHLTPRQAQILSFYARGFSVPEIAAQEFISVNTVRWHLDEAKRRLGAPNMANCVIWALHWGDITINDEGAVLPR